MLRNITFDSMDHKLYPIPNEEYEDLLSLPLKGEHMSNEQQTLSMVNAPTVTHNEPEIELIEPNEPEQTL
jgi:hypothetical protein